MSVDRNELQSSIDLWIRYNKDKQFNDELEALTKKCDIDSLAKKFLSRLDFGTAGLRGRMGVGFNCMNDVVIIQTAQGLLAYLQESVENLNNTGFIIGYDGRHLSRRFAELTAAIFLTANVKVMLFSRVCPTPFVPFAISHYKAGAGVMVTASHNPKDDNGYKVYWGNGAQIISPHDKGIREKIMQHLEPRGSSWNIGILKDNKLLIDPLDNILNLYLDRRTRLVYDLEMNKSSDFKFVYTAMHGVGYFYISKVFERLQLKPLTSVQEQQEPDPEFPTVKFPNPEEGKSALNLSFAVADKNNLPIILANDPDADRFAVAEKLKTGKWKIFSGNETGALLGWWLAFNYKKRNPNKTDHKDVYLISSTVSSKILQSMAKIEGFSFEETLTGFKWMGNLADNLNKAGKTVLFAFEESIGFMCDTACLDKDGISAASTMAELVLYLQKSGGLTLFEKLQEIYDRYGQHLYSSSYFFCYDSNVIRRIFHRLRNWDGRQENYPSSLLNKKYIVSSIRDLTAGYDSTQPGNKPVLPVSKSSEMITFEFENSFICTLRTSGTEPKIKYYCELISSPGAKDVQQVEHTLNEMVQALVTEFLQPELNKLVAKSD